MRLSFLRASIFVLLTCICFTAASQTAPTWNWVQQIGGIGLETCYSIAADAAGNIYQTGSFSSSMQIGNAVLTTGPRDMYLVKYNRQGIPQWAMQTRVLQDANGQAQAEGVNVVTDPTGNVYVSGSFRGTVTFGSIAVTATSGTLSTFVAKFTSQGTAVWAIGSTGTGTGNRTEPSGLTANANGEVFLSGLYKGTTVFGNLNATSQGDYDVYLLKINAAGMPQWLRSAGGAGIDYPSALAVAPGNGVYMSGGISAIATFGPLTAISRGSVDAFLTQYDAQGTPQWLQTFGGSGYDEAGAVVTAPSGEVYTVGDFQLTADFGTSTLISQGSSDGFVVKCTAQGSPLWARAMGGSGGDATYHASWSPGGALYISGLFNGTAFFGSQSKTSAGATDIFAAQYDAAGNVGWVERCGGPNIDQDGGIITGPNGTVFLGGNFSVTAQFGPLALTSRGSYDSFIGQLQDNTVTGLRGPAIAEQFMLYPNPVGPTGLTLTLPDLPAEPAVVEVVDLTGRTVQSQRVAKGHAANQQVAIPTAGLAAGQYLLRYQTEKATVHKRFVVL